MRGATSQLIMNTAIIVAAGSGLRFAAARPKQFADLLGKPLIIHTLEQFESCPVIDQIVLVLSHAGQSEFGRVIARFPIAKLKEIVTGGRTRAESVRNGLDAVDASGIDIVAVHDGARPLVTVDEITRTIEAASATGAACLVSDVTDTVKQVDDDGRIVRTVDRRTLRRALTPQAFRYDLLQRAFEGSDLSESITDECYLVERLGLEITCVEGSARNIKITRPEDMVLAEAWLMGV